MQSTGNDIIALGTINQKRSRDRRFYSKFLSDSEQSLYQKPDYTYLPWEQYVWLVWSVKESTYKYLKRGLPGLVFSPLKMIIHDITLPADLESHSFTVTQWEGNASEEHCYEGTIIFEEFILHFKSKMYTELIATVVSDDESFKNIFWGIQTIAKSDTGHQSISVRSFLLNKLNNIFPDEDLRVEKTKLGYPFLANGIQELQIPISFAHHDRYIAYSFFLEFPMG